MCTPPCTSIILRDHWSKHYRRTSTHQFIQNQANLNWWTLCYHCFDLQICWRCQNQNLPIRSSRGLSKAGCLMSFRSRSRMHWVNWLILAISRCLTRLLFLLATSNINLDFLTFFQSKIHVIWKLLIQFFLVAESADNYTWLRLFWSWNVTPKSKASFLSLNATPTHTYPPFGFYSLTA